MTTQNQELQRTSHPDEPRVAHSPSDEFDLRRFAMEGPSSLDDAKRLRQERERSVQYFIDNPHEVPVELVIELGTHDLAHLANSTSVDSPSSVMEQLRDKPGVALFCRNYMEQVARFLKLRLVPDKDYYEAIYDYKMYQAHLESKSRFRRAWEVLRGTDQTFQTELTETLENLLATREAINRDTIKAEAKKQKVLSDCDRELAKREQESNNRVREASREGHEIKDRISKEWQEHIERVRTREEQSEQKLQSRTEQANSELAAIQSQIAENRGVLNALKEDITRERVALTGEMEPRNIQREMEEKILLLVPLMMAPIAKGEVERVVEEFGLRSSEYSYDIRTGFDLTGTKSDIQQSLHRAIWFKRFDNFLLPKLKEHEAQFGEIERSLLIPRLIEALFQHKDTQLMLCTAASPHGTHHNLSRFVGHCKSFSSELFPLCSPGMSIFRWATEDPARSELKSVRKKCLSRDEREAEKRAAEERVWDKITLEDEEEGDTWITGLEDADVALDLDTSSNIISLSDSGLSLPGDSDLELAGDSGLSLSSDSGFIDLGLGDSGLELGD